MAKTLHGYTAGVFDLYHPGHALLLERAASRCDHLTVGLSTDALVLSYKPNPPVMTYAERFAVVSSVRWVDSVVPQTALDKTEAWERLRFDVLFVGDDWHGHIRWKRYERELGKLGVPIVYLPHTDGISSSDIRKRLT